MKKIESICSANFGRSEPSRLLIQMELDKRGAEGEFVATSSGTLADIIWGKKLEPKDMIKYVEMGCQRNLVSKAEYETAVKALADYDKSISNVAYAAIKELFSRVADVFNHEEAEHRKEAMEHFSIKGQYKKTQDQTVVDKEAIAALSMAESNNNLVKKIYALEENKPTISTIGEFATGIPGTVIADAYGKGKEVYFAAIEQIMDFAPKIVEKIVR